MDGEPSSPEDSTPETGSLGLRTSPERSERVQCVPNNATEYHAFISYSHAEDKVLAPRLREELQRFAKPWRCLRALRLFLDEKSLPLTPALWPTIERELENSRYLLLLASPRAARSDWVPREVSWWIDNKPPGRILLVHTAGNDLDWDDRRGDFHWEDIDALPEVLKGAFAFSPLRLDLRWTKSEGGFQDQDPRFRDAVATIAATLHGKPKDQLIGQDLDQFRKNQLRERTVIFAAAAFTIVILALAGFSWKVQSEAMSLTSQRLAARAVEALYTDADLERAALLAVAAFRSADTPSARGALLLSAATGPMVTLPRGAPDDDASSTNPIIQDVAIDRSGEQVAAIDGASDLRIWNRVSFSLPIKDPDFDRGFKTVAFLPDGESVLVAGSRNAERCLVNELPECNEIYDDVVESVAVAPSGDYAILGTPSGRVVRRSLADETVTVLQSPQSDSRVNAVAIAENGMIAAGRDDGAVSVWEREGEQFVATLAIDAAVCDAPDWGEDLPAVTSLQFDSSGSWLAVGDASGNLSIWTLDPLRGACYLEAAGSAEILELDIDASATAIVITNDRGETTVWDKSAGRSTATFRHQPLEITSAVALPDFSEFVTGDRAGGTRIWSTVQPPLADRPTWLVGHGDITAVALHPAESQFAFGSAEGVLKICRWNDRSCQQLTDLVLEGGVSAMSYSPSGDWLVAAAENGAIFGWRDGAEPAQFSTDSGFHAVSLAVDETQGLLVAAGEIADPSGFGEPAGYGLEAWNLESRNRVDVQGAFVDPAVAALAPDCPVLVVAAKNLAKGWNTSGTDLGDAKTIESPPGQASAITFSVDGSRLASGRDDGSIAIWETSCDPASFVLRAQLQIDGVGAAAARLSFSPDGRYVVSGHDDGSVALWDIEVEEPIGVLGRLHGAVTGVQWIGVDTIVAVAEPGAVVSFSTDPRRWAERACLIAGRELTAFEARRFLRSESSQNCPNTTTTADVGDFEVWLRQRWNEITG